MPSCEITTGAGKGGGPHVQSFNSIYQTANFYAWASSFAGGVPVARGDVDGDGVDEIVVGSGPGSSSFAVFSADGTKRFERSAYGASFKGGVFVAVGDIRGDSKAEIIVGPGSGLAPRVRTYDGNGSAYGTGFMAYDEAFTGGVRVAVGRVTPGAKALIHTVPGPGGGPHLRSFDYAGAGSGPGTYVYTSSFTGGVFVGAGDVDSNGIDDIVVGPDSSAGPHVRVFTPNGVERMSFFAFSPNFTGGVRVAAGDLGGDGRAEIIVGAGPGAEPIVRVFDNNINLVREFNPYPGFRGGAYVAVARFRRP